MPVSRDRHREYKPLGVIESTVSQTVTLTGNIPKEATHLEVYSQSGGSIGVNVELRGGQGTTILRTGCNLAAGRQLVPIPNEALTYFFQHYSTSLVTLTVTWLEQC